MRVWTAVLLGLGMFQTPIKAQSPDAQLRVPVVIVANPDIDYGNSSFVIVRRSDESPYDLIMLHPERANVGVLSRAIATLVQSRSMDGDTASRAMMIRPTRGMESTVMPNSVRSLQRYYPDVLKRLKENPSFVIPEIGDYRSVTIWLDPQRHG